MVDEIGDGLCNDGVKPVVLEPRAWLDHAIVDVVMDCMDGSARVVYDRTLLVRWTAMQMLYDKNKYTDFNSLTVDVLDERNWENWEQAEEHVDYNTIRAMAYMGPNRPLLTMQTTSKGDGFWRSHDCFD